MMPAIVQHAVSGEVLMLGYMNKEALEKTEATGKVTFYSRTNSGCGPRVKPRAMSSMW
jgi:phosphoribosyl-ATP pyrophosphohydrolase/phosphoribosyl-AMP cyclohydrolase